MAVIENRDFVIVGQQPWDVPIGSNCKDIAIEISKHNRVLYINAPLDRRTQYQQKNTDFVDSRLAVISGERDGLIQINDNFWVFTPSVTLESINFIKITAVFRWLNKINNKRFAQSIGDAIKRLGFADFILFNDSDMFRSYHLKELLSPALSIYYSRDNMLATNYWAHHGKYLEPELIGKSDLAVANSAYLANYCKTYNPNSFYVGQGCDFSQFQYNSEVQIPNDLASIQGPVLGYVGALLSARLDEQILLFLAKERPNWSIVLVGPEDDHFKKSALHKMPNVHFLGSKKPEMLAAYIKGFDVCLNPQALNALTIGNYPRKIDEYLAMGKPTIATKTEAIDIFAAHVYIAETKEEYLMLAEKALLDNSATLEQQRVEFAQTHTWEKNVEEIYKAIRTVEEQYGRNH
jgi:glycosyltransferase involved in cell wall biosynthesis